MNPDIKGFLNVGRQAVAVLVPNTIKAVTFSGVRARRLVVYAAMSARGGTVYFRVVTSVSAALLLINLIGIDVDVRRTSLPPLMKTG